MKRLLGDIRRADADFGMFSPGDSVAVGVSGGKDSMVLLRALALYRQFDGRGFALRALTLVPGEPFDVATIRRECEALSVPLTVQKTDLFRALFEERREKNPCALCARVRRGALVRMARDAGCNKLALGHHREDALETLLLNVLHGSRLATFSPVTALEDSGVTVVRPMIYTPEKEIIGIARRLAVPACKNPCPMDGHTERQEMKELLALLCARYPTAKESMLEALKNDARYGLWSKQHG